MGIDVVGGRIRTTWRECIRRKQRWREEIETVIECDEESDYRGR